MAFQAESPVCPGLAALSRGAAEAQAAESTEETGPATVSAEEQEPDGTGAAPRGHQGKNRRTIRPRPEKENKWVLKIDVKCVVFFRWRRLDRAHTGEFIKSSQNVTSLQERV